MINSDAKSQSNTLIRYFSHNVLICVSKLLDQDDEYRAWQDL